MKQKFLILLISITFFSSSLFAQLEYTFPQFFHETGDFIVQPGKWDAGDYLKIGIVFTTTGLSMFADEPIQRAVQRDGSFYKLGDAIPPHKVGDFIEGSQKQFFNPLVVAGRMYGELYSPIIFFAGFAGYSLLTGDSWSRKVAYEIGQASLYGGGLTFLLKMAIGRARPSMEVGSGTYKPFSSILIQDYHSIPSGHSQAAIIISTILARNVNPVWLKVLFYVPTALTFGSRIYQNQHWVSDAVIGGAMGFFIATWCVDKHENSNNSDKDTKQSLLEKIKFQPIMMGNYYGMNMSLQLF